MGPWESLVNPRTATVTTTIQRTQLLRSSISSSSVRPLPPTGHPEACWNTMPLLAQAPTSGPNVEVTSSGKNGIVSMEKHNALETFISSTVLYSTRELRGWSDGCSDWIQSITRWRFNSVWTSIRSSVGVNLNLRLSWSIHSISHIYSKRFSLKLGLGHNIATSRLHLQKW